MISRHKTLWALLLALLVLTTLTFLPGLDGSFIFDDFPNIVTNSRVHAESLDARSLKLAATAYEPGVYGRPLATVSFAIDHALWGMNAWGFKLTNLLVHLANTILVFSLLRRVLALPRAGAHWGPVAAFAIALLWAIHPLQVSSVLYVVQRMETLALTFVLLALLVYLRGRRAQMEGGRGWPWLVGSAVLACIGMLSKETAVLYPAYALAMELTVLGFEARSARTRRALRTLFLLGLAVATAIYLVEVLPHYLTSTFSNRNFSVYERLFSQLRVLPLYLGQMLLPLPANLTFYYDNFPKSTSLLNPATTLTGAALLLAMLTVAWHSRKRLPLISLGIMWFFIAHLLTSNVFNLELVFEHRNYFALLGILLAVADLVRRIPMRDGPALKHIAVGIVIIGFGGLAVLRSATWGDPLHLAMSQVAKNPGSARASSDLATLYVSMSDGYPNSPFYKMGADEFERASRLPASSPLPEQGLILMAATTGQPVKAEWWDRLTRKIKTRPIGPQEKMAVTGLVRQRFRGLELDDSRLSKAYEALLARGPMPATIYSQYGDYATVFLKDSALAAEMYVLAIERNPEDAAFAGRVVATLLERGRVTEAQAVLARARAMGLTAQSSFQAELRNVNEHR